MRTGKSVLVRQHQSVSVTLRRPNGAPVTPLVQIVHFGQSPRRTYMHLKHGDAQRLAAGAGAAGLGGALPLPGNRFKEFPAFTAKDILDEHEMCIR